MIIAFPEQARVARNAREIGADEFGARPQSATVIILPVIRIERYSEQPGDRAATRSQRRRRRRRTPRSKVTA